MCVYSTESQPNDAHIYYYVADTDDTLTSPPTPRESEFDLPDLPPEQSKLKRRRVRGFSLDPNQEDGDECSIGSDDFPPIEAHACIDDFDEQGCIDDIDVVQPVSVRGWLAASILPRFSDQASANSTLSVAESTLSQFSYYRQLRDGSLDEDYERVLKALFSEWIWAGGFVSIRSTVILYRLLMLVTTVVIASGTSRVCVQIY